MRILNMKVVALQEQGTSVLITVMERIIWIVVEKDINYNDTFSPKHVIYSGDFEWKLNKPFHLKIVD